MIEMLSVMALIGILVTLGAPAFRHYWLGRALDASRGSLVADLQAAQEQAVSDSNPISYGARFRVGQSTYDVLRYDTQTNLCTVTVTRTFESGVQVAAASFAAAPAITVANCPNNAGSAFLFFYPRGTATAGNLTLRQPSIDRTRRIDVVGLTGKVLKS